MPLSNGLFAHRKDFAGFPAMDILEYPYKSYAMLMVPPAVTSLTLPAYGDASTPSKGFLAVFFDYLNLNLSSPPPFWSPKILVSFDGNPPGLVPNGQFEEVNFLTNPSKIIVPTATRLFIYNGSPIVNEEVIVNILVYRSA